MKSLSAVLLTFACLTLGYGFYRINQGDLFNSIFFTLGILGLLMSVFRKKQAPDGVADSTAKGLSSTSNSSTVREDG